MSSNRTPWHRLLFKGMTLVEQPQGYTNSLIRVSPDGRLAAFVSSRADGCGQVIVVHNRQAGTWTVVPPPDERVFEERRIRHVEWGGDGHSLYVVEAATVGIRETAPWHELTDGEVLREVGLRYDVLYAWRPGDATCKIIDRSADELRALATAGNRLRLVAYMHRMGGVAHLRVYRDDSFVSSKILLIKCDDQNIEGYERVTLLTSRNELWFSTRVSSPNPVTGGKQSWIAMMDLAAPEPVARLVLPNAWQSMWTPDERRMVCFRYEESDPDQGSLCLVRRDSTDAPVVLESFRADHGIFLPHMVGIEPNGRSAYFRALVPEQVDSSDGLHVAGNVQIYRYALPDDAAGDVEGSLLTGAARA